jgi:ribonuclease Z
MAFKVLILGCGSAIPTSRRNPSAQIVSVDDKHYLIDCGEATQNRLRENKIKLQRIEQIFISHLHGDHYLGLIGLLQTMHLLGRTKPITVFAPEGLKKIIDTHFEITGHKVNYPLTIETVNTQKHYLIFEDNKIEVYSIPLDHRIPCSGYLIKEKQKLPHLNTDKIIEYNIPVAYFNSIKKGKDFIMPNGQIIKSKELTLPAEPSKSYAYCSDTAYYEPVTDVIKQTDVLYHEATFTDELANRAAETKHSTAKQAATIARKANVKTLILGHFSNRYAQLCNHLQEAKQIFENTLLAEEGKWFDV